MDLFKSVLIILACLCETIKLESSSNRELFAELLGIDKFAGNFKKYTDVHRQAYDISATMEEDEIYDFIIVGSGSAGSVLANRLTEIFNWRVLLLEAGKVENAIAQIPMLSPALQFTHYDWQYLMEYEPGFAQGMESQRLAWPRGKALGGTSVINYMIYTRGNPLDYDKWASDGNPGWSYEEVLPYFLKSENSTINDGDPRFHNTDGEWSISNSYQSPLVHAFIQGGQELGYNFVDYTAPDQIGVSTVKANLKNGLRHSVAKAFLFPIRSRPNLKIRTSALVTKILIDPQDKIAYGVEYDFKGQKRYAYVTKEVILSAGTFASAQLLMLSGIGPSEQLYEHKIPIVNDLPVGKFLQDHITYVGLTFVIDKDVSSNFNIVIGSIEEFLHHSTGPLTSLGGVEGIGYIQALNNTISGYPDIELIFVGGALNSDYGVISRRSMRITDDIYNEIWRPLHDIHTWTIFPMLLHPKSVGSMKLRSSSPYDYPLFHGNYLTDPGNEDLQTMIASIRFIQTLAKTDAFQKFNSRLHDTPIPTCRHLEYDSDGYWECCIRSLSITLHHQVGTVKMGPSYDETAVVNHRLQVWGVKGLRVADCSVIPFAITAHTNAPSVMIGEKAADFIKSDWGVL